MSQRPVITAIIPYFQRTPGLLTECVESILGQSGGHDLRVVVVDDESPLRANDELPAAVISDPRVTVVRQSNAGPGAARNRALDSLPVGTTYVALMDSDDKWEDGYIDTAVPVLEQGYDLFFADSRRHNQSLTRFGWSANTMLNLSGRGHRALGEARDVYAFEGDFFDFILRRSNILGGSSMIYRLAVHPTLRFSIRLFNGQDRLFKLHLVPRVRRVAFTTRVFGIERAGVNIFDSAFWGSPKSLKLLSSYIELPKTILAEIELDSAQRNFVRMQLAKSRRDFVASMVHLLAHGESLPVDLICRTFGADPMSCVLLLPNLARVLGRKVAGAARRPSA